MTLLISHLPCRVAAPLRKWRDILALHQEGVCREHRAVAHGHAVVDERANAYRAPGADLGSTRLESAVLLRLALDQGLVIENTLVPDGGQGRLGDVDAVVVDPLAHPHTDQPPQYGQERRAVEKVEEADGVQLPDALDPPEAWVVNGADGRRGRAKLFETTFHYSVVDRGDDRGEREQ